MYAGFCRCEARVRAPSAHARVGGYRAKYRCSDGTWSFVMIINEIVFKTSIETVLKYFFFRTVIPFTFVKFG